MRQGESVAGDRRLALAIFSGVVSYAGVLLWTSNADVSADRADWMRGLTAFRRARRVEWTQVSPLTLVTVRALLEDAGR